MLNNTQYTIALFFMSLLLQGCATQDLFESNVNRDKVSEVLLVPEAIHYLKPDDKISVSIWGHDDLSVGSIFGIYSSNEVYGKWVLINQNGEAVLPKLGSVCLYGLTTEGAASILRELYGEFIVKPIIVVKVLNREVTILGEVGTPGNYLLEKESNSLIEIIGRAGGMNFYSNKKEVKLIRNNVEYYFDLTKMEDFSLNNINLQSGDVLYIPSRKGKMIDKKAPTLIPFTSVITTIGLMISILN